MVINETRPGMTTFIPQQTHETSCFIFTVRGPSRCLCFMQIEQTKRLLSVLYKIMSREITRKDILMLLPLSVLSLADPITDFLALMEFYSEGHKIWFAVGLIFFILPCFMFSAVFYGRTRNDSTIRCIFNYACLWGFHPLTAVVQRLEAFIMCSRKLWRGETIMEGSSEFKVLADSKKSALCEAVFESAPQFIIQLYIVNVQQEPASIIQMISLPVSFVSLVWSFQTADEDAVINIPVIYKILNILTLLLLLSTRLFAITYFVVVYKWFIVAVYIFHFIILWIMHRLYGTADSDDSTCEKVFKWYMLFGKSWVGYVTFDTDGNTTEANMKRLKIITVCSYIFLMLENYAMILLYYIPFKYLNPWYSLPLTVCVCLFSFLGAVLRFKIALKFVLNNALHPQ